jgi:hypothetical protein
MRQPGVAEPAVGWAFFLLFYGVGGFLISQWPDDPGIRWWAVGWIVVCGCGMLWQFRRWRRNATTNPDRPPAAWVWWRSLGFSLLILAAKGIVWIFGLIAVGLAGTIVISTVWR